MIRQCQKHFSRTRCSYSLFLWVNQFILWFLSATCWVSLVICYFRDLFQLLSSCLIAESLFIWFWSYSIYLVILFRFFICCYGNYRSYLFEDFFVSFLWSWIVMFSKADEIDGGFFSSSVLFLNAPLTLRQTFGNFCRFGLLAIFSLFSYF